MCIRMKGHWIYFEVALSCCEPESEVSLEWAFGLGVKKRLIRVRSGHLLPSRSVVACCVVVVITKDEYVGYFVVRFSMSSSLKVRLKALVRKLIRSSLVVSGSSRVTKSLVGKTFFGATFNREDVSTVAVPFMTDLSVSE